MTEYPIARRDRSRARGATGIGRLWTGNRVPPVDPSDPSDTTEASVRTSNGEATIARLFVDLDEAGGPVSCNGFGTGPLAEENSPFVDGDVLTAVYSPGATLEDATERVLPAAADPTIGVVS